MPRFRRRAVVIDVAAIGGVAALLVGLHLFTTPEQKAALTVDTTDRNAVTLLTAAYVHFGDQHLLTNVLGYLSASTMAYLLCLHAGRRRLFRGSFLALVVVVPPVVNVTSGLLLERLWTPIRIIARGFSGVVAGFAGLVLVAIVAFVARRDGPAVAAGVCGVLTSLLTLQLYWSWTGAPSLPVVVALAGIALLNAVGILAARGRPQTRRQLRAAVHRSVPVVTTYALLAAFVVGLFPPNIVRDSGLLNVYAHGTGLLAGIVVGSLVAALCWGWDRYAPVSIPGLQQSKR